MSEELKAEPTAEEKEAKECAQRRQREEMGKLMVEVFGPVLPDAQELHSRILRGKAMKLKP